MKPTIQIKTRLHDGIYQYSGGGETRVEWERPAGPRNLMAARDALQRIRAENIRGFGNVGCGRTWMEIGGRPVDEYDLYDLDDGQTWGFDGPRTATDKARHIIAMMCESQAKV
jgi:hypothetical protein